MLLEIDGVEITVLNYIEEIAEGYKDALIDHDEDLSREAMIAIQAALDLIGSYRRRSGSRK